MNRNQQAQALISAYVSGYEKVYGVKPIINRYRIKWGMIDVIESVGYDRAKSLLEYYFRCDAQHTPENFMNSFDKLDGMLNDSRADEARRARLREETRRRMEGLE